MSRIETALRAAAPGVPRGMVAGLEQVGTRFASDDEVASALGSDFRLAHLVGQTAHESAGFTRLLESLYYTTPERLCAVWPTRFPTLSDARPFLRAPRDLARRVYNGRLGNFPDSDDGWIFRGRGLLQLTGRANYCRFGQLLDLPLEDEPDRAEQPVTAWRIAIAYLGRRKRRGLAAFAWADRDNTEMVTRIVNGGTNGLAERRSRTVAALAALGGPGRPLVRRGAEGAVVEALQRSLVIAGFGPGAIDGDFGPRTEAALRAFQAAHRLAADGIAGPRSWAALNRFSQAA